MEGQLDYLFICRVCEKSVTLSLMRARVTLSSIVGVNIINMSVNKFSVYVWHPKSSWDYVSELHGRGAKLAKFCFSKGTFFQTQ